MSLKRKNLFEPVVNLKRLSPDFQQMGMHYGSEPARLMANEVFQDFPDRDGNFTEQFQTTGFDSRMWELYLYAYLSRSGYQVHRDYEHPDFIIEKGGVTVAIEATTVNPTQTEDSAKKGRLVELTKEELKEKLNNELPIRFGGPLFSKLKKKYWKLKQCRGIPLAFAIEAFHEEDSLYFSDYSLGQYLYGLRHYPEWTEDGHLIVRSEKVQHHKWREKIIPSNFFQQPDTQYVSGILFSNSGTFAKFLRMGWQEGYYRGDTMMVRRGTCYDPNPDAAEPIQFKYQVDDPPILESWGQGLMLFHNPNALYPIPHGYFIDVAESYIKEGQLKSDMPPFYPFMSQTLQVKLKRGVIDSAEADELPIESILKCEFYGLEPARHPATDVIAVEKEWFADKERIILGVLLIDRADNDWTYVVLGRDQQGTFRWIDGKSSIKNRYSARDQLLATMQKILKSGQKVFPQE